MKSLAIGRDDFKHIIENDSYYIDKTKFIEELYWGYLSNSVDKKV